MDLEKIKHWLEEKARVRPRPKRPPSPYGSFYERMMASAIDMAVIFSLFHETFQQMSARLYAQIDPLAIEQFYKVQTISEFFDFAWRSGFAALWMINFTLQIILIGVVFLGCQMLFKTTPGKWLLGLKLTTRDGVTFPPAWRLVLRYLAYIPSCAPLMLGIFWIMFDKQSRGWHDMISGTQVMTLRPEGWYLAQLKRGYHWIRKR